MATTEITMKIDENLMAQLQKLLENLGLDANTLFTMTAKQAIRKQALPFTPDMESFNFGPKAYTNALKNFNYIDGQAVISKDDEWREETEWDNLYEKLAKERGVPIE